MAIFTLGLKLNWNLSLSPGDPQQIGPKIMLIQCGDLVCGQNNWQPLIHILFTIGYQHESEEILLE